MKLEFRFSITLRQHKRNTTPGLQGLAAAGSSKVCMGFGPNPAACGATLFADAAGVLGVTASVAAAPLTGGLTIAAAYAGAAATTLSIALTPSACGPVPA